MGPASAGKLLPEGCFGFTTPVRTMTCVDAGLGGLGSVSVWVYLELRPFDLSGFTVGRLNGVCRF